MKTRSKLVTEGVEKAPMRSLFYAMGYTEEELARPLVAVVSAHSEIVPGHMHLDKITEAVKAGVRMAGGTPIMVPAIGVCDGIAMGHIGMKYSLASRELIADSVETMLNAHGFDGAQGPRQILLHVLSDGIQLQRNAHFLQHMFYASFRKTGAPVTFSFCFLPESPL